MKCYRLRHKPTGLFFKPSKYGSRSNLSEQGKLYVHGKPSIKSVGREYHHPSPGNNPFAISVLKVDPEDWEIVVYDFVETGVIPCAK